MTNINHWKTKFIFVKETLILEACPDLITSFRHGLVTFNFPYPDEPFDEVLRDRLICYLFEARIFPEPILYLAGLVWSWEEDPSVPSIFVDDKEMSFKNFMKLPGHATTFSVKPAGTLVYVGSPVNIMELQDGGDHDASSIGPEDQSAHSLELMNVDDESIPRGRDDANKLGKRRFITTFLKESSLKRKEVVEGSSSKPEGKRRKHAAPKKGSSRGSAPPISASGPIPKGVRKHPRVLTYHFGIDEQDLDPVVPEVLGAYYSHNLLSRLNFPSFLRKLDGLSFDELTNVYDIHALHAVMVGNMLVNESKIIAKASWNNQDVEGSQVVKNLRLENDWLSKELSMVRDVAESLKDSRKKLVEELDRLHPSVEEQKAVALGRTQALNEVYGLGSSWDFKVIKDYDPEAEKIFDDAAESFYKLEFPYISMLVEKADKSFSYLAAVEPLAIKETVSYPP
ncbi:hypothetical protein Tco_1194478 [Tanacetum coccineum]